MKIGCVVLLSLLTSASAQAVAIRASSDPVADEPAIEVEDREYWAFQPLKTGAVDGAREAWRSASRALDALVPGEKVRADSDTLIRRMTFDLTGLPPTVEELGAFRVAFEKDADVALEALADRLLASPAYGEHWAQWWLDLARFAETDGFEHDKKRERAWQYRDWVIDALNRDLPFDQFVKRQIAGDLMAPKDELATGFLFSGPDMSDINDQDERRHVVLNEITSTIGSVFLGLTVGCAQCHDHPYDPVSQADFYRLRAFFDDTVLTARDRPLGPFVRPYREGVPPSTVFVRGDFRRPGPGVRAAVPRVLGGSGGVIDRLGLANWIASADNALFLRSMANRLWQQHFGKAIAGIPDDLGHQGELPADPALLDWIAAELPRQAWSLKRFHKGIVLSRAFQQTDLEPRRLTGEMLRDSMLAVAGDLNPKAGGEGVHLPLPPEVSETLLSKHQDVTKDTTEHRRRSIYAFARRNARHPLFDLFDRPDALNSCSRRNQSTTAPQALLLLNSDFAHERAAKLAEVVAETSGTDVDRAVREAIRRCFSRTGSDVELAEGRAFVQAQIKITKGFPEALGDYCLALMNSNEFVYID